MARQEVELSSDQIKVLQWMLANQWCFAGFRNPPRWVYWLGVEGLRRDMHAHGMAVTELDDIIAYLNLHRYVKWVSTDKQRMIAPTSRIFADRRSYSRDITAMLKEKYGTKPTNRPGIYTNVFDAIAKEREQREQQMVKRKERKLKARDERREPKRPTHVQTGRMTP